MKKIFSLFIILCLLSACGKELYETIDTNKALELMGSGAIVVDVREVDEFEREHIPDAVNIPLSQVGTIDYDKNAVIIVYCQSGIRSKQAADQLAEMGYENLYNLDGGILNWGGELAK